MEREISSGAMLGIVLLALAAVIGLGFGVFAITKGVANEGTVGVQDSLGSLSSQVFLDYDQKIVTGNQVISALKTFEGKPYAVLIATKALNTGGKMSPTHDGYPIGTSAIISATTPAFINYNAVIAGAAGGALPGTKATKATAISGVNALLTFAGGTYTINNGFAATNGNVIYDKETAGLFKTGNGEFVATGAKFQANLIKDKSDNILGVTLEQQ